MFLRLWQGFWLFLLVFRGRFLILETMEHRHINHATFSTVAIEDIIERGDRSAWIELRDAAASKPLILQKILRVCAAHSDDPRAQRYHVWRRYASRRVA